MEKGFTHWKTYYTIESNEVDAWTEESRTPVEDRVVIEQDDPAFTHPLLLCIEAAQWLFSEGLWQNDGWYSDPDVSYTVDYGTGEECEETAHPFGWSDYELAFIDAYLNALKTSRRYRSTYPGEAARELTRNLFGDHWADWARKRDTEQLAEVYCNA